MVENDWHVVTRENLAEHCDPLQRAVDDLVRRFDPGGYTLTCPVAGCTWSLDVPRMELDPELLDAGTISEPDRHWVVRAEGVPREDLELILSAHCEWHAVMCETVTDEGLEPEGWRTP